MCMGGFACRVSVHYLRALPVEDRSGHLVFGAGVTDVCALPCGCLESNPGPPEE